MSEHWIERGEVRLYARVDGLDHRIAPTVVFANSLGTDLRLWHKVLPLLPDGLRLVRYDMRGHGRSSVPPAPYSMGALIGDAEAVCDALAVRDCVLVGMSLGGMVAQGLAVKRLDLVRAMVLANTAAKVGTPELWRTRIEAVRAGGVAAVADAAMERWFSRGFRGTPDAAPWREMLTATPAEGYMGACAAIAGTDFYTPTSGLRLPTLGIASSEDTSTPPDLVRETVDLIPGSQFRLIRKVGHLSCAEDPIAFAEILAGFLEGQGLV